MARHWALVEAVLRGNRNALQELIDAGAVNAEDKHGNTALRGAAGRGSVAEVRALLDAGADLEAKDDNGNTALMYAVGDEGRGIGRDYAGVARLLIEAGADLEAKDSAGDTALMVAAREGHAGVARLLIEAGAGTWTRRLRTALRRWWQ